MTKQAYLEMLHKITTSQRLWESRAADEVRATVKAALQAWYRTGVYDADAVNTAIKNIYASGVWSAADKTAALSEKYLTEALAGRGWKQSLELEGVMVSAGGKQVTVKAMPIEHNFELADSVWGGAEYKARAQAVVDYGRLNGRPRAEIAKDLDLLCSKNGGKRLIRKYDRLYDVRNRDGSINQKRWQEGWERDWCEANGVQFGSNEYEAAKASGAIDDWIKAQGYKDGRQLLPKVSRDFDRWVGKSDLDYRATRLMRTEAATAHQKVLTEIGTGKYATGKFMITLSAHRDAWKCKCQQLADECKRAGGWTLEEMAAKGRAAGGNDKPPWHPNCSCTAYPVPLSIDEIARRAVE